MICSTSGLPSLLDGAGGALPDLVGFGDAVRITRQAPDPDAALDEWGQAEDGAEPTVLYDGPADLQTRPANDLRDRWGDAALNAQAELFLPPEAGAAFDAVRVDDAVTTPLGPALVKGRAHDLRALLLQFSNRPA